MVSVIENIQKLQSLGVKIIIPYSPIPLNITLCSAGHHCNPPVAHVMTVNLVSYQFVSSNHSNSNLLFTVMESMTHVVLSSLWFQNFSLQIYSEYHPSTTHTDHLNGNLSYTAFLIMNVKYLFKRSQHSTVEPGLLAKLD